MSEGVGCLGGRLGCRYGGLRALRREGSGTPCKPETRNHTTSVPPYTRNHPQKTKSKPRNPFLKEDSKQDYFNTRFGTGLFKDTIRNRCIMNGCPRCSLSSRRCKCRACATSLRKSASPPRAPSGIALSLCLSLLPSLFLLLPLASPPPSLSLTLSLSLPLCPALSPSCSFLLSLSVSSRETRVSSRSSPWFQEPPQVRPRMSRMEPMMSV